MAPQGPITKWGEWEVRAGRRVRPVEVNGQVTCWLYEDGRIVNGRGDVLSEDQTRILTQTIPRSNPSQPATQRPPTGEPNYQIATKRSGAGNVRQTSGDGDPKYGYPAVRNSAAPDQALRATDSESSRHTIGPQAGSRPNTTNTSLGGGSNLPSHTPSLSYQRTPAGAPNYPEFFSDRTTGRSLFTDGPTEATPREASTKIPNNPIHDPKTLPRHTVMNQQRSLDPAPYMAKDSDKYANRNPTATDTRSVQPSVDIDGRQVPLSREPHRSESIDDTSRRMESMSVNDKDKDDSETPLRHHQTSEASSPVDPRGRRNSMSYTNPNARNRQNEKDPKYGVKPRHGQTGNQAELRDDRNHPPISEQFQTNMGFKGIKGRGKDPHEELNPDYVLRKSDFYEVGRVFAMLWHESDFSAHATYPGEQEGDQYKDGRFNVRVYTTIRRMVVVRDLQEAKGYCICSPIVTYGGQGVNKSGIPGSEASKHTVIHMNDTAPSIHPGELQKGMIKKPIAVRASRRDQKLLPLSRLNFGKLYSVEHNVLVMDVGRIVGDELRKLQTYHYNTFPSPASQ